MIYQLPTLIRMVRTTIGIDSKQHPLIRCRDPARADLDEIIAQAIVPAASRVYTEAPIQALSSVAHDIDADTIYWHDAVDGTYSGHIFLPDDYHRLMIFEMSDWTRPVVTPLTDDSPCRSAFYSPYASVAGTWQRPCCLVTDTSEGHCLIFRSCHTPAEHITHAKYIPLPAIDPHGGIDLPPALLPDIISAASSIILQSVTVP